MTLRDISDGEDPEVAQTKASETDLAANLAGRLKAESDREKEAAQHAENAEKKLRARDGQGCVAELEAHDRLDPRPAGLSTNPTSGDMALVRAAYLMLAGQCKAAKEQFRRAAETRWPDKGDDYRDERLRDAVGKWCQGNDMTDDDRRLQGYWTLRRGGEGEQVDGPSCVRAYRMLKQLGAIPDKPPSDPGANSSGSELLTFARNCLRNARDCEDQYGVCINQMTWIWGDESALQKRHPGATFRSQCEREVSECLASMK